MKRDERCHSTEETRLALMIATCTPSLDVFLTRRKHERNPHASHLGETDGGLNREPRGGSTQSRVSDEQGDAQKKKDVSGGVQHQLLPPRGYPKHNPSRRPVSSWSHAFHTHTQVHTSHSLSIMKHSNTAAASASRTGAFRCT